MNGINPMGTLNSNKRRRRSGGRSTLGQIVLAPFVMVAVGVIMIVTVFLSILEAIVGLVCALIIPVFILVCLYGLGLAVGLW